MSTTVKLLAVPCVWLVVATATPVHGQNQAAAAEAEYAAGRFPNALMLFEARAAAGDTVAAEVAGQMLFYGETLYGKSVARDPERARHYLAQAARDGRPLARHLIERIGPPATGPRDAGGDYVPGPAGC
ncbi:MAG: hypothetical protein IH627_00855 [Rubrivivax sp.]|nr:hypothetical protein [Rubrivivax sp.]